MSLTTYSDIDPQSLIVAERNVASNGLQNRVVIKQSLPQDTILRHLLEDGSMGICDFVMCNPPFYASKDEVVKATEDKEFDPSAVGTNGVCTGADVEMIAEGGEVGFVRRMMMESVSVGDKCQWFTSLLGKHTSVASLVETLQAFKIDNYGITEFIQGHTRRWGIMWSFGDLRLPDNLVRTTSESLHSSLPPHNTLRQRIESNVQLERITEIMEEVCREIDGVGVATHRERTIDSMSLRVWAEENTWSRKARRRLEKLKREMELSTGVPAITKGIPDEATAAVVLVVECSRQAGDGGGQYWLEGTWLRGKDRDLFETLWSHLCRRIVDRIMT
ncbi:hypothetical protein FRC17_010451 [Serendipita sp. 399]|nr:hypothetical protein FRC17_010451 [Serendipita sp. 399]